MSAPLICPIIVHYQSPESCLSLLESLKQCSGVLLHPIVVDNHSTEQQLAQLKAQMNFGTLVESPHNLGYAGGLNLGIRTALEKKCDFLWCLTQDLTFAPETPYKLMTIWAKLEKPGLLGSLTDLNGTDAIYFYKGEITIHGKARHPYEGSTIQSLPIGDSETIETDYVNGASVFLSRAAFEKIGPIPEEYFLYFEDTEWGLKSKRSGLQNYVSLQTRLHHHRPSKKIINWTAEYYCRRNSYFFKARNGFAKPWTKWHELTRLRIRQFKSLLRRDSKMAELLGEVIRDIKMDRMGKKVDPQT